MTLLQRLLGPPLPRSQADGERLPSLQALPILSSDALSSVAYATEAALGVLVLAGSQALRLSLPITLAILVLIAIVVASYRQTIEAYPQGGGSYVVARENLGTGPSLLAAAALLVDYTLTAAVSLMAGTQALSSPQRLVGDGPGIGLQILESPFASLIDPFVAFVAAQEQAHSEVSHTIVMPMAIPRYRFDSLLLNQRGINMHRALDASGNRVFTLVRYYLPA
jgi:amino acid transporter